MSNVKGFTNTQKIKEEAALWLLKIEEGSPLSEVDAAALRQWVNSSDVHREIITRMSKTWDDMDVLAAMMSPSLAGKHTNGEILKSWLLAPVFAVIYTVKKTFLATTQLFTRRTVVGTSILLSSVLCVWLLMFWQSPEQTKQPGNLYVTALGEQSQHVLPDGSTLWLNSSSKVEVQFSPNFRRIILRQGEAHFEVEKDPSRPFEVYSQGRLVRAIGTAFSVYKLGDRIEVFVSEGKVELAIVDETFVITPDEPTGENVEDQTDQETALTTENTAQIKQYLGELVAGQSISIAAVDKLAIQSKHKNVIQLDAGEIVRKLSWLNGKLVFAGESLEEVVTEISRHTSMRIDVLDPKLKKMRIGGHFQAGETDALFLVLESGFGIHVNKLSENHVELTAKE